MKKLLFLLPAAALALASCSNDQVVEQPTKVISAEALQIYPELQGITRGTVWDNSNFTQFKLTTSGNFQTEASTTNAAGGAPLTDVTVTKTGGTWAIGSTTYYWPSKTATSSFTAWAPTDINKGSYTASTTIADQKDIVVAFNSGSATDFEAGVPLKFRHILSQIVIKADNEAKNDVQIIVKGIRVNNVSTTGTWDLPEASTVSSLGYSPWTSVGTSGDYTATLSSNITLTDGAAIDITGDAPLLLIPQQLGAATIAAGTGQYLSVLVNIKDLKTEDATKIAIFPKADAYDADKYAWAAVDVNTLWEPGKKYIYTLHFTKNGYGKVDGDTTGGEEPGVTPGQDVVDTPVQLIFDVDVVDWTEAPSEHNL